MKSRKKENTNEEEPAGGWNQPTQAKHPINTSISFNNKKKCFIFPSPPSSMFENEFITFAKWYFMLCQMQVSVFMRVCTDSIHKSEVVYIVFYVLVGQSVYQSNILSPQNYPKMSYPLSIWLNIHARLNFIPSAFSASSLIPMDFA